MIIHSNYIFVNLFSYNYTNEFFQIYFLFLYKMPIILLLILPPLPLTIYFNHFYIIFIIIVKALESEALETFSA